jgi:L-2,4-diaminobutyrate transaminase
LASGGYTTSSRHPCRDPIGLSVYRAARRLGLLLRPGADFVGIAPPLVTTIDEADEIVGVVEEAIREVAG